MEKGIMRYGMVQSKIIEIRCLGSIGNRGYAENENVYGTTFQRGLVWKEHLWGVFRHSILLVMDWDAVNKCGNVIHVLHDVFYFSLPWLSRKAESDACRQTIIFPPVCLWWISHFSCWYHFTATVTICVWFCSCHHSSVWYTISLFVSLNLSLVMGKDCLSGPPNQAITPPQNYIKQLQKWPKLWGQPFNQWVVIKTLLFSIKIHSSRGMLWAFAVAPTNKRMRWAPISRNNHSVAQWMLSEYRSPHWHAR